MPRTRNPYPAEFREQVVALARTGRSVEDLAREFEPCAATIHGWIKQADRDGGHRADGLTSVNGHRSFPDCGLSIFPGVRV
jgi:transposase